MDSRFCGVSPAPTFNSAAHPAAWHAHLVDRMADALPDKVIHSSNHQRPGHNAHTAHYVRLCRSLFNAATG
jgi:hypothetical protein